MIVFEEKLTTNFTFFRGIFANYYQITTLSYKQTFKLNEKTLPTYFVDKST